jgi:hypothetical protein
MTRRKRIKWGVGDLFAIPLKDKDFGILQAVDLMMTNVVYVAIFKNKIANIQEKIQLYPADIISLIAITKEGLDFGYFKHLDNYKLVANRKEFNNEKFATAAYVGAKMYDFGLVSDFLNAYHELDYWNNWANPNYLDEFLTDLDKKPKTLKIKIK